MVPNSDFSLNSNVSSPYTQTTVYSNMSEHSHSKANSISNSNSNLTIDYMEQNLPINDNILNFNQCAQLDSNILNNNDALLSLINNTTNSNTNNIHNSTNTMHSHSHEIRQNDDGSTSTTPYNINAVLNNKEQNKLIHLDPVPNFQDKSDIKPWLQKIFYPMGIEIVIERSDNTKVIFKCKASKRGKKNAKTGNGGTTIIPRNNVPMRQDDVKLEVDTTECNDSLLVHNTKHISIPKQEDTKVKLEKDDTTKTKKKRSVSKFNVCPFRIRATYSLKRQKWSIVILNNTHSHELVFNPESEEYKKFKFKLRANNELDVIKKFDELEYRVKSNLPINNLTIPCDCGLTNEIASFNIVLPKNNKPTTQRVFKRTNRQVSNNSTTTNNNDVKLSKMPSILTKFIDDPNVMVDDSSTNNLDHDTNVNEVSTDLTLPNLINRMVDLDEIDFTDFFNTNEPATLHNNSSTTIDQIVNPDPVVTENNTENNPVDHTADLLLDDILEDMLKIQTDVSNWLNDV